MIYVRQMSLSFLVLLVAFLSLMSSAEAASRILRLGHILAPNDPTDQGARKFAELVKARTGGQIEVRVFPASQLGTGPQQIEQVRAGALDMFVGGIAWFDSFKGMEDLRVFSVPPLFRDQAHARKALDGDLGQKFWTTLDKDYGITVIAYNWWWPPRQLLSKKAIRSAEDVKGLKLRVPEVKMYVLSWGALGASPTPTAWGEVYLALSQGVVDAVEAGMTLMYGAKHHEVAKNLTLTNHTYVPVTFIVGSKFYQSLSDGERKILREAAVEAGEVSNQAYIAAEREILGKFKAAGVTVIELPNRDAFFAPMEEVAVKLEREGQWSAGLYQKIKGIK